MNRALNRVVIFFVIFLIPLQSFAYTNFYKYEGKELDPDSGLYNFDLRQYNPNIGQFIQADTYLEELLLKGAKSGNPELEELLENPQRLNERSFKINNPPNTIDPSGQNTLLLKGLAGTAVGTGIGVYQARQDIIKNLNNPDVAMKNAEWGQIGNTVGTNAFAGLFGGFTSSLSVNALKSLGIPKIIGLLTTSIPLTIISNNTFELSSEALEGVGIGQVTERNLIDIYQDMTVDFVSDIVFPGELPIKIPGFNEGKNSIKAISESLDTLSLKGNTTNIYNSAKNQIQAFGYQAVNKTFGKMFDAVIDIFK